MILGQFGCALCAEGVITGNISWGASRVGYTLGDAIELGVSCFLLTDCGNSSAS